MPGPVVTNADIADRLGVDEEWLAVRTGTSVRHVRGAEDRLDTMAAEAATLALKSAGIAPAVVDLVLVATTTADEMSPHAAAMVADDIGATGAGAMDVNAACTGFLACLTIGASLIESGRHRTVVVVGADALYRYLDPDDRGTAMLFGDGAGAVVLTAVDGPSRLGPACHHSDGGGRDLIRLDRDTRLIRMDGPTVYKYAVGAMVDVTREALESAGTDEAEIDWFFYHQANARILAAVGRRLGLDTDKVVNVIGEYANTSAASLPIALSVAYGDGRLRDGDRILLAAFGAGMVWSGMVATWGHALA